MVLAVCGSLALVHVPFGDTLAEPDRLVADGVYDVSSRSPILLWSAHVASFLGSAVWLTGVVAGVAWYLIRRDQHRRAVVLVALAPGGVVINKTIKRIIDRNRPDFEDALAHAAGSSFPSGHAMNPMVVYGMLLTLGCWQWDRNRRRRLVVTGAVLVIAIAASRVALGVHYLSDVAAGLLLGLVWVTSLTRPSHRGGAVKRQTTSG